MRILNCGALVVSGLLGPAWFLGAVNAQPTVDPGPESLGGKFPTANVVTQHNDNLRSGAQLLERVLTTSSVQVNNFGKLATRRVAGQIYAQPLYVQGVEGIGCRPDVILKGVDFRQCRRNVVYVATMKNSVYAFDADDTSGDAPPLWKLQLSPPFDLASDDKFKGCFDISGRDGGIVGITSTPVIDAARNTMYLVSKVATRHGHPDAAFWLVAVDIRNGALLNFKLIEGRVFGDGAGSVRTTDPRDHRGPSIKFQAKIQHQRPGLLLSYGVIYVAFGSHCDKGGFHGWLFAYDAATMAPLGVFNTTPNKVPGHPQEKGAIWQSGQGLRRTRKAISTS